MTDSYEIHKGVDIPKRARRIGAKYPFHEMEVDDCFFVDACKGTIRGATELNTLRSLVSRMHKRMRDEGDTRRFRVLRRDSDTVGVWRAE